MYLLHYWFILLFIKIKKGDEYMSFIETISMKIGHKITNILEKDDEFEEVMVYGAINFFQTIYAILTIILLGFICGVVYEALIISVVVALLRKYSGGVHASTPNKCAIFGAIGTTVMALLTKYIMIKSHIFVLIFGLSIFVFTYFIVYSLAPMDSFEKPINNKDMRRSLKKASLNVVNCYFLTSFVLFYYNYNKNNEFVYNLIYCILMGMVFQGFSLTKYGHKVLSTIDNSFK